MFPLQRGWVINPMGMERPLPIWVIFFAAVPAVLGFILVFMESQITSVIINKPERRLRKGSGFHLDMLLIGLLMAVNGFLGMPLMCAATVRSITHTNSLSVFRYSLSFHDTCGLRSVRAVCISQKEEESSFTIYFISL